MIIEEIRNIKSSKKELRKFGLTMGIVLALFNGFIWWRGKDYYFYFFIPSILFILLGLIVPLILKPFHKVWMSLAVIMSWFMTRVILSILFYLGITPMGLLARLFGKDFLRIKFNKNTSNSYWIPKEIIKNKGEHERQF